MKHLRFAVLVAVAVSAVAVPSAAYATFPGHNGLIAFAADTGSGYQVYTLRPNGHDLAQITMVSGDARHPHWSPDGRRIVFELDHPSGPPFSSVEVMNPDGSGLVDLTGARNGAEGSPSFTPDGSRIVFERFDDITNVDAIWSMDLTGGDRHEITVGTGAGVTSPDVSPDGTMLSYLDSNGFGNALFVSSIDGSNPLQLTPFTFDLATGPTWAPDGQHLVFTYDADPPQPGVSANVATVRPDGTDLHYLTHYTGGAVNAFVGSYSPDGQWIIFRLEDHGLYALYRMQPDGGALHAILGLSSFRPRDNNWGPQPQH
jgi:Tol biopolymer transport system component